jgi:hypothetical protein
MACELDGSGVNGGKLSPDRGADNQGRVMTKNSNR